MTIQSIEAPDDLVAFYDQISGMQDQLLRLHPRITVFIDDVQVKEYLEQKKYWLHLLPFPLDPIRFIKDYLDTASFIIKTRPQVKETLVPMNELVSRLPLEELAERTLNMDRTYLTQTAVANGVSSELFVFMLQNAIRPQLRAWAEGLPQLYDKENWQQPYCPVCGQEATISRIRPGDGQRNLFCGHCFTEWEYHHFCCPQCGNDEPKSIKIISLENDWYNLIYACEKCRSYVKTLHERQGEKTGNLFIEGARTFYLDLLAQREGYHNREIKKGSYN